MIPLLFIIAANLAFALKYAGDNTERSFTESRIVRLNIAIIPAAILVWIFLPI